jgi:hypothetical protein
MKCANPKCGGEWTPPLGQSITVCPFCQERIVGNSGWQFFDNTKDLLAFITAEYGNDALFGRKHFSDHSDPLMPEWQKDLVKDAFKYGAVKFLQDNVNSEEQYKERAVKQAVGKLVTERRTAREDAERVIWEFTNALVWGMPEPQGQNSQQIIPPPPPPGPIGGDTETNKLMIRAWQFAEDSDWQDAAEHFNKVLLDDPTYAPAFLGLICVDLKLTSENELAHLNDFNVIMNHKHYKRIVTDPSTKSRVDGYIQTIKNRIDAEQKAAAAEAERKRIAAEEAARRKRVQDAYDIACKIMNSAKSMDDCRKAITAFSNIDSNYQDINKQIKSMIVECESKKAIIEAKLKAEAAEAEKQRLAAEEAARQKRVQDAFDSACKIMNAAQTIDDYRKAITSFSSIGSIYPNFRHGLRSLVNSNIAECEKKMQQMVAELDKVLAPLREEFDPEVRAAKQAQLQEQRKADLERLNEDNAKTKADIGAKCTQIKQAHDTDHMAWQEECTRLKTAYDAECKKWETEVNAIKAQSYSHKSQGLCPHCGGTLKGLLSKKCTGCGKVPSEPIVTPSAPTQPNYPDELHLPQMPTYTPKSLDESRYVLKDSNNQRITLAGIDWRILDMQGGKLFLISEIIIETRSYNAEKKDITWENCTLRKYLNNDFQSKLGVVKTAIAETRNSNPINPWYGTSSGNATTDKVFLLSLDEVCRYFGDSTANLKKGKNTTGNDYYIEDSNDKKREAKGSRGEQWWWWLRSPGNKCYNAARVNNNGGVDVYGMNVHNDSGGVRPAFWLDLKKDNCDVGSVLIEV